MMSESYTIMALGTHTRSFCVPAICEYKKSKFFCIWFGYPYPWTCIGRMTTYQTLQVPATSQNFGTSLDLDLFSGGSKGAQILSISCSVLGKFAKIVCWRPPPGELAPHLREILDPSLLLWICTFFFGVAAIWLAFSSANTLNHSFSNSGARAAEGKLKCGSGGVPNIWPRHIAAGK